MSPNNHANHARPQLKTNALREEEIQIRPNFAELSVFWPKRLEIVFIRSNIFYRDDFSLAGIVRNPAEGCRHFVYGAGWDGPDFYVLV